MTNKAMHTCFFYILLNLTLRFRSQRISQIITEEKFDNNNAIISFKNI